VPATLCFGGGRFRLRSLALEATIVNNYCVVDKHYTSRKYFYMAKTNRHIGIRLSEEDFQKLQQAAEIAWPGARMSQASIILSLALREAERVLGESPRAKGKA